MDYLTLSLVAIVVTLLYYKYKKSRDYFKKYGIPQPHELPFLGALGLTNLKGKYPAETIEDLYKLNKEAKYVGCHAFNTKLIIIRDPELIKSVLVKNFEHFAGCRLFVEEKHDPLFGKNLAFISGHKWRNARSALSPVFTSRKLRSLFDLMLRSSEEFTEQFVKLYGEKDEVDTKDAFSRYANDVIASCAFGIEMDSLKDQDNKFYVTANRSSKFHNVPFYKFIFIKAFPELARKLGLRFISAEDTDYFFKVIKETIKTRQEQKIARPDLLQLLMESQDITTEDGLMDITAHAFIFFLGGFDSTASIVCLLLNELAAHQNMQRTLQAEVDEVLRETSGKLSYDIVNYKMPYMEAVLNETLRLYPVSNLTRICSKDFELPPALPGGKPYVIRKGEEIWIPNIAIHKNPEYYEDPEKFKPERFLNKKVTLTDVNFMGFGMGPRSCIGNRFAIIESKVLLTHLLSKCNFSLCQRSPYPFESEKFTFVPTAKNGFYLRTSRRKQEST